MQSLAYQHAQKTILHHKFGRPKEKKYTMSYLVYSPVMNYLASTFCNSFSKLKHPYFSIQH